MKLSKIIRNIENPNYFDKSPIITLQNSNISDEDIKKLCATIASSDKKVSKLWLNNNKITSKGLEYLSELIVKHPYIIEINLSTNCLDKSAGPALESILKKSKLSYLELGCNNIEDKGLEGVIAGLKNNKYLTKIGLFETKITDSGVQNLLKSTINNLNKLNVIDIRSNNISLDTVKEIYKFTKNNSLINTLKFDGQIYLRTHGHEIDYYYHIQEILNSNIKTQKKELNNFLETCYRLLGLNKKKFSIKNKLNSDQISMRKLADNNYDLVVHEILVRTAPSNFTEDQVYYYINKVNKHLDMLVESANIKNHANKNGHSKLFLNYLKLSNNKIITNQNNKSLKRSFPLHEIENTLRLNSFFNFKLSSKKFKKENSSFNDNFKLFNQGLQKLNGKFNF